MTPVSKMCLVRCYAAGSAAVAPEDPAAQEAVSLGGKTTAAKRCGHRVTAIRKRDVTL